MYLLIFQNLMEMIKCSAEFVVIRLQVSTMECTLVKAAR